MKLVLSFILLLASLSVMAEDNQKKCEVDLNQNALRCQKMRQICGRMGPAESLPYEMCMEDVYACVMEGRDAYKACLEKTESK